LIHCSALLNVPLSAAVRGCISCLYLRIEVGQYGGKLRMFRMSLYVLGISAFVAAWAIYQDQRKRQPVPAKKAAAMLQEAWADHHTHA
jgi:hypothetical protein